MTTEALEKQAADATETPATETPATETPAEGQQTLTFDKEAAYAVLHNRVYAPTFFEKLAQDYQIAPQSPEHAEIMLKMAAQLRAAHEEEQLQKSPANGDFLKAAQARLDKQLGVADTSQEDQVSALDMEAKQAAALLSFDPEIAAATLAFNAE